MMFHSPPSSSSFPLSPLSLLSFPLSLPTFLLLLLQPVHSSAPGKTTLALTFFATDDPSLPDGVLEAKADDRSLAYYDTTLSKVQFHLSNLEPLHALVEELIERNMDTTLGLVHGLQKQVMALTNNSLPSNEIGETLLYSEKPDVLGKENTLICFISGFFPPALEVTFQKNGKPIGGEVNSSHLSFSEDWRFYTLQYTHIQPTEGDIYSCKVVHNISKEERVTYWEPEVQVGKEAELDRSQLIVLICGVIIGILGTAVGFCLCFWLRFTRQDSWIIRINPFMRVSHSS
ncbi:SLA class II histocompatibility antigen, DQ haplotype C alpha chain-like [Amblyraja radiata]|uniref:SLA class II histocompatibility antigen, DQ haplotype C alpha chain-like n=1 Tax=Amblyraja radiata TaxID=386614 RepID=UPI0014030018|nr:SLA class II histocompatibility antigen, DQ haplotype C alpha chain-like [Amblyraja radiata]